VAWREDRGKGRRHDADLLDAKVVGDGRSKLRSVIHARSLKGGRVGYLSGLKVISYSGPWGGVVKKK